MRCRCYGLYAIPYNQQYSIYAINAAYLHKRHRFLGVCRDDAFHEMEAAGDVRGADDDDDEEPPAPGRPVRRRGRSKTSANRSTLASSDVGRVQDVLVGHELGHRPLLADDELDVDTAAAAPPPRASAPFRRLSQERPPAAAAVTNDDVFALAPFRLPPKVFRRRISS